MKELLAIRSEGYIEKGGSTKPWKIITLNQDPGGPLQVPYVLKLFSPNYVAQQNCIGKEFLCNFLAKDFDLSVPDCGFIKLTPPFLSTLEKEQLKEYERKYQGNNFASRLHNGAILYNENMTKIFPIRNYANIFTFDCLIFNTDRGGFNGKPNILVNDDGFILIDHELTLHFISNTHRAPLDVIISHIKANTFPGFTYTKHIFYPLLKHYQGNKKTMFEEARESLKNINLAAVKVYISELEKNDISIGSKVLLNDYLSYMKQNADKFINILTRLVS